MTPTFRPATILLAALLFSGAPCADRAQTQTGLSLHAPDTHAPGRKLREKGIPNFGEVTPTLYRGGQPSPEGFEKLAQMGVNIVVDTGRSKRDEKQIRELGMKYVSLPWYCPFPKETVFARFLELIRENPDKKIFVHCRLGDDRTGLMVAAYRIGLQGWTADEAMKEMQLFGYTPVHHLMCPGLARYEKSLPERLQKDPALRDLH
jgi:tyrosine-protein phosphatase SIW14